MLSDEHVHSETVQDQWYAGACSMRGGSHVRKNTPCQDASVFCCDEKQVFAAVADGHGSRVHIRSAEGAQMACEAARDVLCALPGVADAEPSLLAAQILDCWKEFVLRHALEHPFDQNELNTLMEDTPCIPVEKWDIVRAYGTTLNAAIVKDDGCLVLCCGDGLCTFLLEDGSYEHPVADDENCFAGITTSLCHLDRGAFRWYKGDAPSALFLTTDGITNNVLNHEGLRQWYDRLLLVFAERGMEGLLRGLEKDFDHVKGMGFGDDMSLALMLRGRRIADLVDMLIHRVRCTRAEQIRRRKENKMRYLENDVRWAKQAIIRRQKEYEQTDPGDEQLRKRLSEGIEEARRMLQKNTEELERLKGMGLRTETAHHGESRQEDNA